MEKKTHNINNKDDMATQFRLAVRPKEAAFILSISERTLFDLIKDGQIRSIKLGRAVLIPTAELEEFVALRTRADAIEEAQQGLEKDTTEYHGEQNRKAE